MRLIIIHEGGEDPGRNQLFSGKSLVRIGRHPENDCVFGEASDSGVSAFHAEIDIDSDRISIRDLGSRNGLFVNGERVSTSPIAPGDRLELGKGGPAFRVELEKTAEKKYGDKTLGMIVEKLLKQMQESTARKRRAFILMAALLVSGFLGIGYTLLGNRSIPRVALSTESQGATAGESIASDNRFAIFLIAGRPNAQEAGVGELRGFCTAFAVSPELLATNGHCAESAEKRFAEPVALMNGSTGSRYPILRAVVHPDYRPGLISPDVGLLLIAGKLKQTVRIASSAELGQLRPGAPVFLYGFPGPLNRTDAPEATFVKGEIGRITAFDQTLRGFDENTLLQHSAFSSAGTSGSPIFNMQGRVVGINSGGYVEDGKPLGGYNFGMRIDLIKALVAAAGAR